MNRLFVGNLQKVAPVVLVLLLLAVQFGSSPIFAAGDYDATVLDIWLSESTLFQGDVADIRAEFRNDSSPSGPDGGWATFDVRFLVIRPNGTSTSYKLDDWEFEPNATKTAVIRDYTFDQIGTYTIRAEIYDIYGYPDWDQSHRFHYRTEYYEVNDTFSVSSVTARINGSTGTVTIDEDDTITRSGSISGSGSGTVTYHWEYRESGGSWQSLLNKTTSMSNGSASIPFETVNNNGVGTWYYRVVVTSPNSVTSNEVKVIVNDTFSVSSVTARINGSTGTVTIDEDDTITRSGSISGSGSGTVTYHWEYKESGGSWQSLLNKTTSMSNGSASIPSQTVNNNGVGTWYYRVVVTSPNSVTSNEVKVIVNDTFSVSSVTARINGSTGTVTIDKNDTITRYGSISGSGSGTVTYHWEYRESGGSWQSLLNKTTSMSNGSASIPFETVNNNGVGTWYYRVVVTSPNSKTSNEIKVIVNYAFDVEVTSVLVSDTTPCPGDTVTVSYTVRNNGDIETGVFTNSARWSTDADISLSDTELDYKSMSSISTEGSRSDSITVTIPSETTVGQIYYIGIYADSEDVISPETSNSNNGKGIAVTIQICGQPDLCVSTSSLDFGTTSTSKTFTIQNCGAETLTWEISTDQPWIGVSADSGLTTTETDTITVTVSRMGLNSGPHSGTISVTSNGGTESISISMQIPGDGLDLCVSTSSLDFGTTSTSKTFTIQNCGRETLTWEISTNQPWLSINPDSGSTTIETEPATITVTVDRTGLTSGPHPGTINIASNGGTESISVSVQVPEADPELYVSTESLSFNLYSRSSTFYIENSGGGILEWNVSEDEWWIDVNPITDSTGTETDTVTVIVHEDIGLYTGMLRGSIMVYSNGGTHEITVVAQWSATEPIIRSLSPSYVSPGQTSYVLIEGENFIEDMDISFGSGVTIHCATLHSLTEVSALITVHDDAASGWRSVSLTGPGGTGSLERGLHINDPSTSKQYAVVAGSDAEILSDALDETAEILISELVELGVGHFVSCGVVSVASFAWKAYKIIDRYVDGALELHIRKTSDPCGSPVSSIRVEPGEKVSFYAKIYTALAGTDHTAKVSITCRFGSPDDPPVEPIVFIIPDLEPSELYYIEFSQEFNYGGFYTITVEYRGSEDSVYITVPGGEPPVIDIDDQSIPGTTTVLDPLTYVVTCPVDLAVVDPDGLVINKNTNEIPGATYIETDLDGDEDLDDMITIPYRKEGDYQVTVVAEAHALPEDTYSLTVSTFDRVIYSIDNVKVCDIPSEPYVVAVTSTNEYSLTPVAIIASVSAIAIIAGLVFFLRRKKREKQTPEEVVQ